jgi:DNA-directed RNA polymerase specialized sigma24 family protein
MKKERSPTQEEFDKLLHWFHPDRNIAAGDLAKLQNRLVQIFTGRGCVDADELAYEVINRVAVRIETVVDKYPSAASCCLAFVENVHREWLRDQKTRINAREPPKPRPADELEREDRCLEQCLNQLDQAERGLFVRYFEGEGRARIIARDKLAEELEITANALRIKAHRLRKRVRLCIEKCLSE